MRLVLQVDSDNENADDPTLCIVDLTPELAQVMLNRIAVLVGTKRADKALYECYYMEWGGERYMNFDDPEQLEGERWNDLSDQLTRGQGFVELPDDFRLPDEDVDANIECPQMCVRDDAVQFTCIPKHCHWYIRTREIPLATITRLIDGKGAAAPLPASSVHTS